MRLCWKLILFQRSLFNNSTLRNFQESGKVNPELTSKPSASEFFIKLLDILQTSSGTFALVRVKDQEFWVQQGEWLEDFEVFEVKEDKLVLKKASLGLGKRSKENGNRISVGGMIKVFLCENFLSWKRQDGINHFYQLSVPSRMI